MSEAFDCIVVGAGISGLMAARHLHRAGRRVVVLDKGRGVGGRMATRRFEDSVCDHGAQFMTIRSHKFQEFVDEWQAAGLVQEWYRRRDGIDAVHPRFRGAPGMTAIPKSLAQELDVRLQSPVSAVRIEGERVRVELGDGVCLLAASAVLTPPVPQTLTLLNEGNVALAPELQKSLESLVYDPCIAVMARLDGPSGFPAPGFCGGTKPPIAWMADNQQKGISEVPAVTIHANAEFSRKHWAADRNEVGAMLVEAATPYLSSGVIDIQVHGWRFSQPVKTFPDPYVAVHDSPRILLAGDIFLGPRVEGAALSGLAVAEHLIGS